jgi:hypothetical protein
MEGTAVHNVTSGFVVESDCEDTDLEGEETDEEPLERSRTFAIERAAAVYWQHQISISFPIDNWVCGP